MTASRTPALMLQGTGSNVGRSLLVAGHNARRKLIEAIELVTGTTLVKHPFRVGA